MAASQKLTPEEAAEAVREFHALGLALRQDESDRNAAEERLIRTLGEPAGMNQDTARKAKQFADPEAGYTPAEAEALCALIATGPSKQAQQTKERVFVFGRTHLIRLLTVPKTRRPRLQTLAVRQGWSTARLQSEIAKTYGTRRGGGRKPRLPGDADELLVRLEGTCEAWRRLFAQINRDRTKVSPPEHAVLGDLPRKVADQVRAAHAQVTVLQELVTRALKTRCSTRESRDPPGAKKPDTPSKKL